jgi:hypothetical protein
VDRSAEPGGSGDDLNLGIYLALFHPYSDGPVYVNDIRERGVALHFRADAAFAKPEVYDFLEGEGIRYAIRLPANQVLQRRIGHLLTRPVGRPPKKPIVTLASFHYQAKGWTQARRVVAKVEWHQGELYPRVGFIVTNMIRPSKRVVWLYNGRGPAELPIKEGKNAIRWTRLSCHAFRHNAVRLLTCARGGSGRDPVAMVQPVVGPRCGCINGIVVKFNRYYCMDR